MKGNPIGGLVAPLILVVITTAVYVYVAGPAKTYAGDFVQFHLTCDFATSIKFASTDDISQNIPG